MMELLGCAEFDVELKALLDALLKDVVVLAARWRAALHTEISASRTENQRLRHRLLILEQKLSHSVRLRDTEDPETDLRTAPDYEESTVNADTKSMASKGDPQQWIPALAEIKEEQMEISVTGRAEHRQNARFMDVLHTTRYTKTEKNLQSSGLKTETENNPEPEIHITEAEQSGDEGTECIEDTEDFSAVDGVFETEDLGAQHVHFSPRKVEEEEDAERGGEHEQFDASLLLTPDQLLHHGSLLSNSESSSLDCSAFLNADTSTASPSNAASGSSKKRKGPRYICNICGKSLSSKYSLTVHFTMHTGDRPYACTQCGKRFVNKTNLQIHQNIHTGAKPYVCTLCPKSFADPSPFGRHMKMHSKELQQSEQARKCEFICNICGKSLSTKQGLSYHLTMHTGERPYTCTWCGKSFVQKHNLKIHQNIHTGAKPYVCTLCAKSFADPSSLKKHKRMHM